MSLRLFHVSEESGINMFAPRPSPQHYDAIHGDVVFAISERLLHQYLQPRRCPRVAYYAGPSARRSDIHTLMAGASYVLAVETAWRKDIRETPLYCYELPASSFELLDANAGYYISYEAVVPMSMREIRNPLPVIEARGVEIMFLPSLWPLAERVQASTLNYSLIRMRYAGGDGRSAF